MMKMVEALFVVAIVTGAMVGVLNYTFIPSPKESSSKGLEDTALTILRSLDEDNRLAYAAFSENNTDHAAIQRAIESAVPPNIVFNMTVIRLDTSLGELKYTPQWSVSNFKGSEPTGAKTTTYTVTSPKVTVSGLRGKITVGGVEVTLFILNCTDAMTWFPAQGSVSDIAKGVKDQLSPWFEKTVVINSTSDLKTLVEGNIPPNVDDAILKNAVVINPLGGTYPYPIGIDTNDTSDEQVNLAYAMGRAVNRFNLTYMCYVGYPAEYVGNPNTGLAGLTMLERKCLDAFMYGIDNQTLGSTGKEYRYKESNPGSYTPAAKEIYTTYGVFPGLNQPNIFVLGKSIMDDFHLYTNDALAVFQQESNGYPGAIYIHYVDVNNNNQYDPGETKGVFFNLCFPQTPDVRITTIGILQQYKPQIYRTKFTEKDTIRFITLTLAQVGAD